MRLADDPEQDPIKVIDEFETVFACYFICDDLTDEERKLVRNTRNLLLDTLEKAKPDSLLVQVWREAKSETAKPTDEPASPPPDDPGDAGPDPTEPTDPLGTASYNITDDKLRFYPFARLSDEDYKEARRVGFVWWPRQKLFAAKWSTAGEDTLLHRFGVVEIEADDEPDDPETRAARFERCSERAGERAEAARQRVHQIADSIPFGQPILVGHHSERHARADVKRIDNGMHKAVEEWKKEAYWQDRAKSALAHAEHRETAPAIYRRIQELEKQERGYKREVDRANWTAPYDYDAKSYKTDPELWERHLAWATRWLEHVQARLVYERALYEASGGIRADKLTLEVGGAVKARGQWREILRVNKKTVTVESGYSCTWKITLDDIAESKTRDEWQVIKTQSGG